MADPARTVPTDEFRAGVTEEFDLSQLSTMSRKRFLALLSASAAFAAAGCTGYRDKGEIVPYTRKPEEVTPGLGNVYASTCAGCHQSCGILIKTREGRPVKIDGNPDHPVNRGKICARGQAAILNLYDPNRLRRPSYGGRTARSGELNWSQIDRAAVQHLAECAAASRQVAVVAHHSPSPTSRRVLDRFLQTHRTARLYTYDLLHDGNRRAAWKECYGTPTSPGIAWESADVILALEADLLGTDGDSVEFIRKFADRRDIVKGKPFNRLYAVEGGMSLTGANADYRVRLRPDAQYEFLLSLVREISLVRANRALPPRLDALLAGLDLRRFCEREGIAGDVVAHLVKDLLANGGKGMAVAGALLPVQVHVVVNYLNEILGNASLYRAGEAAETAAAWTSEDEIRALVERMRAGEVGMVIHVGTNPVFHLPPSLGYAAALRTVPLSVSLLEQEDETSELCTYALPVHHMLESWGDHQAREGILSLQQPVIAPLFQTRQTEAVLLAWTRPDQAFSESLYHDFLMSRWEKEVYAPSAAGVDFKSFWHASLHDGVITRSAPGRVLKFSADSLASLPAVSPAEGFVIGLTESHTIGDGRYANNGWLQELPHPVSKIVWDNYAAVSAATAHSLGIESNDTVEVTLPHGKVTLPVFVQPGQADRYVSVSLGYGRWTAGPIGTGVGTNIQGLLEPDTFTRRRLFGGANVARTSGRYLLASTQEHHSPDETFVKDFHRSRGIIREGTLEQFRNDPESLRHEPVEATSISTEVTYSGVKWAMAIDLNRCVGCNACVAGCNVENNVPVVGKEQVAKGRSMHWIRLDRYYSGTEAEPLLSHQPMLCQHCDHAPCENVCPVSATTHSPDGLNQMAYNRCVGTKYCSNNCPYKVRRFNFFNFRDSLADAYYTKEPVSLLHNPEVTVRSRGVMEKCTFCVQRIAEARQRATEGGRTLRGSDVRTACQDACPAQAILFGDMNEGGSEVTQYRTHRLGYTLLEEVNARPNVTYIAKLRNTHPEKRS